MILKEDIEYLIVEHEDTGEVIVKITQDEVDQSEDYAVRIKFKKKETPWLDKIAKRIHETSKKEERKKILCEFNQSNEDNGEILKIYFTTDNTSDVQTMSSEEVKDYLDEHAKEIQKVTIKK